MQEVTASEIAARVSLLERDLAEQKARLERLEKSMGDLVAEVKDGLRSVMDQIPAAIAQMQAKVTFELQAAITQHELAERMHWEAIDAARAARADDERRYRSNIYISLGSVFVGLVAILVTLWVGHA